MTLQIERAMISRTQKELFQYFKNSKEAIIVASKPVCADSSESEIQNDIDDNEPIDIFLSNQKVSEMLGVEPAVNSFLSQQEKKVKAAQYGDCQQDIEKKIFLI